MLEPDLSASPLRLVFTTTGSETSYRLRFAHPDEDADIEQVSEQDVWPVQLEGELIPDKYPYSMAMYEFTSILTDAGIAHEHPNSWSKHLVLLGQREMQTILSDLVAPLGSKAERADLKAKQAKSPRFAKLMKKRARLRLQQEKQRRRAEAKWEERKQHASEKRAAGFHPIEHWQVVRSPKIDSNFTDSLIADVLTDTLYDLRSYFRPSRPSDALWFPQGCVVRSTASTFEALDSKWAAVPYASLNLLSSDWTIAEPGENARFAAATSFLVLDVFKYRARTHFSLLQIPKETDELFRSIWTPKFDEVIAASRAEFRRRADRFYNGNLPGANQYTIDDALIVDTDSNPLVPYVLRPLGETHADGTEAENEAPPQADDTSIESAAGDGRPPHAEPKVPPWRRWPKDVTSRIQSSLLLMGLVVFVGSLITAMCCVGMRSNAIVLRDALRFEGSPEVLAISEDDDGTLMNRQHCWWKGSTALFSYRVGDEKFYVLGPASYSDIQWGDPIERYVSYVESDPSIARVGTVTKSDVLESTLALGLLAAIFGSIMSWLMFIVFSNLNGHAPGVSVVGSNPEPASSADSDGSGEAQSNPANADRRLANEALLAVEPWMYARFWCLVAFLMPLMLLSLYHDASHHRIRSMACLGLAFATVSLSVSWLCYRMGKKQKNRFDAIRNGEHRWFWTPDPRGVFVASEAIRQQMRWQLIWWATIPLFVGLAVAIATGLNLWLSGHSAEHSISASFALAALACCVVGAIYYAWWLTSYTRRYAIRQKQMHSVFADDVLVFAGKCYQLRQWRSQRIFRLSQIGNVDLLNVELSQRNSKGDRRVFLSIPVPPGCESEVKEIQEFYRVGGRQAS